ncbi:MAG TPA: hypothetical protein VEJ22_07240 [Nitrospirota bacterium]|nr:hypothetical protein [Nitrospirota bacterium]
MERFPNALRSGVGYSKLMSDLLLQQGICRVPVHDDGKRLLQSIRQRSAVIFFSPHVACDLSPEDRNELVETNDRLPRLRH